MPANKQRPIKTYEIKSRVALERIQNLYNDSRVMSFATTVTTTLMGLMLWSSQPYHIVITWIIIHICINFFRGHILYILFKDKMDTLTSARVWAKRYAFVALVSGVAWGSLPWLMFDPASTYNVSAIIIVMFGIVSASNVALSAYPAAFFCFVLPALGGLFLRLLGEGGHFVYVAMMLVVFIAFNLIQSIRLYRMITSSIQQRYENIKLMQSLEVKKVEADKANLDKSRFLAATSHDLRQPLHALDLYLGALEVNLTSDTQQDLMLKAQKSSQSVSELLNALLDVSRLDAGEIKVNIHDIALTTLFADLKSEWVPQFREDERYYRTFPIHAFIHTDAVLLSRMLRNVLANVIRHTNGDVLVGARRRNHHIRIEIWDQGKGIPNVDLQKVFTEFFQLNNPERDRTKGLGLGLAIVKRISLLLNHPVHIKSFPEKGLCFSIDVPIGQSSETPFNSELDYDNDVGGSFILVIDDEEDIRDSLQTLLAAWGCEVLVADSGQEAIKEMQQHQYPAPDAIIADYRLRAGHVGTDTVAEIEHFFKKDIPAMIVTGDTEASILDTCQAQGYTLLHKPLSSNKLHKALQKLLQEASQ